MQKIYKYSIPKEAVLGGKFKLNISPDSKYLDCQVQFLDESGICPKISLWFEVPMTRRPGRGRYFRIVTTGETFYDNNPTYLKTLVLFEGNYVVHLYEV